MHIHCGEITQNPRVEGFRAHYTNHQTTEHHCKMFPTDKDAESWLLDKGVSYDEIERAFETDDVRELPADVRKVVENVATAVTELTMPTKKVEEAKYHAKFVNDYMRQINQLLPPERQYEKSVEFVRDAIVNTVVLAKSGMPSTPEALEAFAQRWAQNGNAK